MIRLLICDDYEPLRAMLAVACGTDGDIEVVGEAAGGREAIEQARALQPDVILLDISMPDVGGLEVLPELLTVAPRARTVVISGLGDGFAGRASALGAVAFLDKRAQPEEIRQVVRQAVRA
jgi:DNA-binding NarL/FixJ family response regulator